MAKRKRKKPTSMVLQHELQATVVVVNRNIMGRQQPNHYTEADQHGWAEAALDQDVVLKYKEKLVLSAARTVIKDKAWLQAVSCQNIFPGTPAIEFVNDRSDHYGGKLEFWLENLNGPKNLQFVIRMTGYAQGGATITVGSSFPTSFSLLPISVNGNMNMTLGNVMLIPSNPSGGLGVLTLEVQFHNAQNGSWQFVDVTFTEAT